MFIKTISHSIQLVSHYYSFGDIMPMTTEMGAITVSLTQTHHVILDVSGISHLSQLSNLSINMKYVNSREIPCR